MSEAEIQLLVGGLLLLATAFMLGATDLSRMPLGIPAASLVLFTEVSPLVVGAAASAAFVAGNVRRGLRARREARRTMSMGGRIQRDALGRWLSKNPLFAKSTFFAGLVP